MRKSTTILLVCVFAVSAMALPATASAELLDPCYTKDGSPKEKLKCN